MAAAARSIYALPHSLRCGLRAATLGSQTRRLGAPTTTTTAAPCASLSAWAPPCLQQQQRLQQQQQKLQRRGLTTTFISARAVANTPHSQFKVSRFYEEAVAVECGEDEPGMWTVTLDGRRLKTPAGKSVAVPSETLAQLIATEWAGQGEHIQQAGMHLSSLTNTALDHPSGEARANRVAYLMDFLGTDTVVCRDTTPDGLVVLQQAAWDPLLAWFAEQFGTPLATTTALGAAPHPPESTAAVVGFLSDLPHWPLVGLEHAVDTSKSLIIPLAMLKDHISAETATEAARVEVAFNTQRFGHVEWAHGIEQEDTAARLASAALFMRHTRSYVAPDP